MSKKVFIEHTDSHKNKYSKLFCMISSALEQAIDCYLLSISEFYNEVDNKKYIELYFLEPMANFEVKRFVGIGLKDVIGSYSVLYDHPDLSNFKFTNNLGVVENKEENKQLNLLNDLGLFSFGSVGGFPSSGIGGVIP